MRSKASIAAALIITACLGSACTQPAPNTHTWLLDSTPTVPASLGQGNPASPLIPTTRPANVPYSSPTPDNAHADQALPAGTQQYTVKAGDTLNSVAAAHYVGTDELAAANSLNSYDNLYEGQVLTIPAPTRLVPQSSFKIIPDSELVYGPVSSTLDIDSFVNSQNGYLKSYTEVVSGKALSGAQVVATVAKEFSVNPRLLLALLEYQSGWVTQRQIPAQILTYPMGYIDPDYEGLYSQLSWTSSRLNYGFYAFGVNALPSVQVTDGGLVTFSNTINAGTAALQYYLALLDDSSTWTNAVSENGFYTAYARFFGIPFDLAVEPLLPAGLSQPAMQLPFEAGDTWSFTGGPHAGWGVGSAWAAIDFAPPGDQFGCYDTNTIEVAVADGTIVRSENGEVVLDLDGDGLEQTGWTVLYMHVASFQRIALGTQVKAGDPIGHPSCEGGVSNGTHLHLARRYNGVWIAADGPIPFNLDGWISAGDGYEYDGTLTRNGQIVTAEDGRIAENQIGR